MSRWFRFYEEALHDPKVQTLPCGLFKTWVNLLCIASKHNGQLPVNTCLNYLLKRRSDHLERDLNTLVKLGLLDRVDGVLKPHNWLVRQYKSDTSTERVKRHREAKRNVSSTVSETAPETEYRDREEVREDIRAFPKDAFDRFWTAYPHKVGKGAAHRAFDNAKRKGVGFEALLAAVKEIKTNGDLKFVPHPATWLNGERWADEHPSGPTGETRGKGNIIAACDTLLDRIRGFDEDTETVRRVRNEQGADHVRLLSDRRG